MNQYPICLKNNNQYMKTKTLYAEQYVDVEYDIEFSDLLEIIESCDENELQKIRDIVGSDIITNKNLDDVQKLELLTAAFKKYSYQELLTRLDIKPYEII